MSTTNIINIVLVSLFAIWGAFSFATIVKKSRLAIALTSSSKRYEKLRRKYWQAAKHALIKEYHFSDPRVNSFLHQYIHESIALREHFVKYGFIDAKFILVEKSEEIINQMIKMKFNTFGRLNWEEEDFIDNYQKRKRKES